MHCNTTLNKYDVKKRRERGNNRERVED